MSLSTPTTFILVLLGWCNGSQFLYSIQEEIYNDTSVSTNYNAKTVSFTYHIACFLVQIEYKYNIGT